MAEANEEAAVVAGGVVPSRGVPLPSRQVPSTLAGT